MNKKKEIKKEKHKNILTRREFLNSVANSALTVTMIGGAAVSWDYMSPNVLFEPPLIFREKRPEEYQPGVVELDANNKIFVVRQEQGYFYCISAICTHLGCLTFWKGDENLIACPCHGSRFNKRGEVVRGPAPHSLPRYLITLDERGQLVVDKRETVAEDYILKV